MIFPLLTLAVAFAAFCVWLTVRIINRRERWAKWMLAGIVVLLAYPLSIGPLVWLAKQNMLPAWLTPVTGMIYRPLFWMAFEFPDTFGNAFFLYLMLWGAEP